MSDWRKYKDRLEWFSQRALNFDLERREEYTASQGWNIDQYEADLPPEKPGEPLHNGSFSAAVTVLREYRFPPPDLITGIFVPDTPLEQRVMLLRARFLGFTFEFGVKINGVIDDTQGDERRWGYRYATLEGHFERGQIEFLIIKNLKTGAMKFKISAFSQTGTIQNPFYRLGFWLFGRRLQRRFARESLRRMQVLVSETLRTGSTPPVGPEVKKQSENRNQEEAKPSVEGFEMELMNKLTGLARPIDLRYPSNTFITALTGVTAVGLILSTNVSGTLSGAGWTFLTWSLGRELDPDQPLTAGLASSGVALLLFLSPEIRGFGLAALCTTGTLMLAARAAMGSTGVALRPGDIILLGLAPTVAQVLSDLPLSGLGVASFLALSVARVPSETWRGAGLGLSAVNIIWFLSSRLTWPWWAFGLLGVLALGALKPAPSSRADNGMTLEPKRWGVAQTAVFAASALTALATPAALWIAPSLVGILGFVLGFTGSNRRALRPHA
jgi:Domain of unknown function (DUF1990)